MARAKSAVDFETQLANLEKIVKQLESGKLPLESAFEEFEAGVKLIKDCQKTLSSVEQKVAQIIEKNGIFEPSPFDTDAEESDEI